MVIRGPTGELIRSCRPVCRWLAFPDSPLVLSTRENAQLRDRLATICITQMSAGSSTAPGGCQCVELESSREQFPITDHRSVDTVAGWLTQHAFRLTWEIGME